MFTIITIPFNSKTQMFDAQDLNQFIFNKKVKHYQVQFFQDNHKSYWTVFLEYEVLVVPDKKNKSNLNEAESLFYEKIGEWRKGTAEKESLPVVACR